MGGQSDEVADDLWQKVRDLAARVEELEKHAAVDDLDADGLAQLDRLKIRAARASRRAGLADALADQLADLPRGHGN